MERIFIKSSLSYTNLGPMGKYTNFPVNINGCNYFTYESGRTGSGLDYFFICFSFENGSIEWKYESKYENIWKKDIDFLDKNFVLQI